MNTEQVTRGVAGADEVRRAVMLVRPTVASVSEVGAMLLKETKSTEPKTYGDEAASYLATLDNLVLNWMAEGKHKELRELAVAVTQLLAESSAKPDLLSKLRTHDQLTVRLDVLVGQVACLLLGDSMAKYMGVLSGKRRENWRQLLLGLYAHGDGAPVRRSQVSEFAPAGMKHDAVTKAVDSMTELGLLAKHQVGPKNVQIELTWAGRRVAQAWLAADVKVPQLLTTATQDVGMLQSERMVVNLPDGMERFDEETADRINSISRAA